MSQDDRTPAHRLDGDTPRTTRAAGARQSSHAEAWPTKWSAFGAGKPRDFTPTQAVPRAGLPHLGRAAHTNPACINHGDPTMSSTRMSTYPQLDPAVLQEDRRLTNLWGLPAPAPRDRLAGAAPAASSATDDVHVARNLETIGDVASRNEEIGRILAVDGTQVALLAWRGETLTVLSDLESMLPLAWIIAPAHDEGHA